MITRILLWLWHYFDVICFVAAIGFAVYGCFLIGMIAGVFGSAIGLVLIGYLAEKISDLMG